MYCHEAVFIGVIYKTFGSNEGVVGVNSCVDNLNDTKFVISVNWCFYLLVIF